MPKFKKVSADEFMSKRKDHVRGDSRDAVMVKGFKSPKSWNPDERSATFVMSTETPDRYLDIVDQAGMDITRFLDNPQGLLFHNSRSWPCGSWSDVTKILNGRPKRTEGKLTFLPEGVDEDADRAARHVAAGVLRTVSIGFIPDWEQIEWILDDDDEWTGGFRYGASELIECSIVPIPAQPDALVKGVSDLALARDLIEEVLDTYAKTPEGLLIPMGEYEKAYKTVVEKIAADEIVPTAWELPKDCVGLFTAEQDAELRALATSDGHDAANAKAAEFKAALAAVESEVKAPELTDEVIDAFVANATPDSVVKISVDLETPTITMDGNELHLPADMTIEEARATYLRVAEAAKAKCSENKPETPAPVVVELKADTSAVEAAVTKVEGLFARLAKQFPMFFPKDIEERIEPTIDPPAPPAPPSADDIAAATAKAAAIRERLASKGLIAA